MEKSQSIQKIAQALLAFQGSVPAVKKEGNNPFFKSKYATLDAIIETIKPALQANKLSFCQFPSGEDELVTILMHESGEYIQSSAKIKVKENTPQAQGSAITYMRRYAISAILGIATEDDDDAETATRPQGKAPKSNTAPLNSAGKAVATEKKPLTDKQKIVALCLKINPELKQTEKYKEYVEGWTQLTLEEKNYPEIIHRLTATLEEKNKQNQNN